MATQIVAIAVIALAAVIVSVGCRSQQQRLASTLEEILDARTDLPAAAACEQNADAYGLYVSELDAITSEYDRAIQYLSLLGRDIGFEHPAYKARSQATIDHYRRFYSERWVMLKRRASWSDTEVEYCRGYLDAANEPGLCHTPHVRAGVIARDPTDIWEPDLGRYSYCRNVSLDYLSG